MQRPADSVLSQSSLGSLVKVQQQYDQAQTQISRHEATISKLEGQLKSSSCARNTVAVTPSFRRDASSSASPSAPRLRQEVSPEVGNTYHAHQEVGEQLLRQRAACVWERAVGEPEISLLEFLWLRLCGAFSYVCRRALSLRLRIGHNLLDACSLRHVHSGEYTVWLYSVSMRQSSQKSSQWPQ